MKGGSEDCVAILLDNHADVNTIGAVSPMSRERIEFDFLINRKIKRRSGGLSNEAD